MKASFDFVIAAIKILQSSEHSAGILALFKDRRTTTGEKEAFNYVGFHARFCSGVPLKKKIVLMRGNTYGPVVQTRRDTADFFLIGSSSFGSPGAHNKGLCTERPQQQGYPWGRAAPSQPHAIHHPLCSHCNSLLLPCSFQPRGAACSGISAWPSSVNALVSLRCSFESKWKSSLFPQCKYQCHV